MQISKHWAWILLLISISVSVVLSSIIFVVTELVSIGEMESIREVKSKGPGAFFNVYFDG